MAMSIGLTGMTKMVDTLDDSGGVEQAKGYNFLNINQWRNRLSLDLRD